MISKFFFGQSIFEILIWEIRLFFINLMNPIKIGVCRSVGPDKISQIFPKNAINSKINWKKFITKWNTSCSSSRCTEVEVILLHITTWKPIYFNLYTLKINIPMYISYFTQILQLLSLVNWQNVIIMHFWPYLCDASMGLYWLRCYCYWYPVCCSLSYVNTAGYWGKYVYENHD